MMYLKPQGVMACWYKSILGPQKGPGFSNPVVGETSATLALFCHWSLTWGWVPMTCQAGFRVYWYPPISHWAWLEGGYPAGWVLLLCFQKEQEKEWRCYFIHMVSEISQDKKFIHLTKLFKSQILLKLGMMIHFGMNEYQPFH
jgi:hypothetical protein